MNIWSDGIPDRLMTKTGALLLGFAIGGLFMIYQEIRAAVIYRVTEPTAAPICYPTSGRPHEAGWRKIPPHGSMTSDGHYFGEKPATYHPEQVLEAGKTCTADACDKAAQREYKSALFWYLSARTRQTTALDRRYGDAGVQRANRLYATPLDREIVRHLQALYAAGVLRVNDFTQNREAAAILMMSGGDAFRPCRIGEQPYPQDR